LKILSAIYYRVISLKVISLHFMQKPIHKHKLLKSQITSTKLQINSKLQYQNLKLQYPMTKTDELAKRQKPFFLKIIFAFEILNFGHCDLFGIWYLCFGISGLSGLCQLGIHGHQSIADRAGELLEEETLLIDIGS
jgi:hypothetical protein